MKTKITAILSTIFLLAIIPAIGATKEGSSSKSKAMKAAPASKVSADSESKSEIKISESAKNLVSSMTTTQKSKLLALLNEGTDKDLSAIHGVAKARAQSIVKARPFANVAEISVVHGIGEATFARVVEHGKSLTARRSRSKTSKS